MPRSVVASGLPAAVAEERDPPTVTTTARHLDGIGLVGCRAADVGLSAGLPGQPIDHTGRHVDGVVPPVTSQHQQHRTIRCLLCGVTRLRHGGARIESSLSQVRKPTPARATGLASNCGDGQHDDADNVPCQSCYLKQRPRAIRRTRTIAAGTSPVLRGEPTQIPN